MQVQQTKRDIIKVNTLASIYYSYAEDVKTPKGLPDPEMDYFFKTPKGLPDPEMDYSLKKPKGLDDKTPKGFTKPVTAYSLIIEPILWKALFSSLFR